MADVFNKTPAEFIDINTMFDVLNNRVGFEAEQLRAIVENTYWLYNYALEYHIPADSAMSDASTNAVQNKVIKAYVDNATSGLATLGNTLTNTRKNAVRILPSSTLEERLDIRPLEFSPTDITQADDIDISEFFLTTPTKYMTCHLKDATARADIASISERVETLENVPDIDLSAYVTQDEFAPVNDNAREYVYSYTNDTLIFKLLNHETDDYSTTTTGQVVSYIQVNGVPNGANGRTNYRYTVKDETARNNITAVTSRVGALEEAIGDIGTLLDTINGEVI